MQVWCYKQYEEAMKLKIDSAKYVYNYEHIIISITVLSLLSFTDSPILSLQPYSMSQALQKKKKNIYKTCIIAYIGDAED